MGASLTPDDFADPGLQLALRAAARRLARSEAEAEDLVQDTVEKGIRHRSRFKAGTNLRVWLFRIMRNAFLDRCRRRHLEPIQASPELIATAAEIEPDEAAPLWTEVSESEFHRAFARLDPSAQQAITLHTNLKLSYVEIGNRLGIPVATVGSRLFRARLKLRGLLIEELGPKTEEALA